MHDAASDIESIVITINKEKSSQLKRKPTSLAMSRRKHLSGRPLVNTDAVGQSLTLVQLVVERNEEKRKKGPMFRKELMKRYEMLFS